MLVVDARYNGDMVLGERARCARCVETMCGRFWHVGEAIGVGAGRVGVSDGKRSVEESRHHGYRAWFSSMMLAWLGVALSSGGEKGDGVGPGKEKGRTSDWAAGGGLGRNEKGKWAGQVGFWSTLILGFQIPFYFFCCI